MKKVQITQMLLYDLIKYHLLHLQDDEEMNARIQTELNEKMQRLLDREEYSKRFKDQIPLD